MVSPRRRAGAAALDYLIYYIYILYKMKWVLEFFHDRRRRLARYTVEAPQPAAAVALGWTALRAEHPSPQPRRWLSLLDRAERTGGRDDSGWVLYRIRSAPSGDAPVTGAERPPASTTAGVAVNGDG